MTPDENNLIDVAPGQPHSNVMSEATSYIVGLGLALVLTGVSFWVASTSVLWGPGVATGLVVLAIAQMGVHRVVDRALVAGDRAVAAAAARSAPTGTTTILIDWHA